MENQRVMRRVLLILGFVALTSCYKTDLYNTNHPNEGRVVITTTPPVNAPLGGYTANIGGVEIEIGADGKAVLPENFAPGEYTAYVYNKPEKTYLYAADGEIIAGVDFLDFTTIDPAPEVLYFGMQEIVVSKDAVVVKDVEMVQITRELNFSLKVDGDAISRIKSVSAKLNGVTQRWDCVNDVPCGGSYSVKPTLTQSTKPSSVVVTRADEETFLSGSINLLGVDSSVEQELTITIEYNDSKPQKSEVVVSDISTQLASFNSDKATPFELVGTVDTPTEVGSTGNTIIDWSVNTKDDVTAK